MNNYFRYFGKKAVWYFVTFIFAIGLNFLLPRLIPGNPLAGMISNATAGMTDTAAIQKIQEEYFHLYGLDKSIPQQFIIYVRNLLHGDFGRSTQTGEKVAKLINDSVWWTLALQLPAILVGWILGNLLGAIAAYIKGAFDKGIFPFFLFLSNIPAFGLAIVMLYIFGIKLKIAPIGGSYAANLIPAASLNFISSVISHYQMPFWSIVLVAVGGQAIGMRSMSIYELNADYVKYSRFLGIKDSVIVRYVFHNAMLPQITGLALSLGTMVGGALVAEIIFSYNGIGMKMFSAITAQDYPLISACTLIITIGVLIANFLVDIVYGFVDPRIKAAQQD
ncbi:MAG: ABC transporter permease [Treponema sp.]|jgi:peptide/nickel transport system permease protein|nr:ABC transporter permease [Treponema sp.]